MDECGSANASKNERKSARERERGRSSSMIGARQVQFCFGGSLRMRGDAHFVPRGSCQRSRLVSGMREVVSFQFCAKIDRENSRESNSVLEGR